MKNKWNNAIVTEINTAIYVNSGSGEIIHNTRPFHGLVFNDQPGERVYAFADGTVLRTQKNDVFYLPKGSNYQVRALVSGGCFAINFDLLEDPALPPFLIHFKNSEAVLRSFREAVRSFKDEASPVLIRRYIYDIIVQIQKEQQRNYLPSAKERLIEPAIQAIRQDFTDNGLSVNELAQRCGISEAYLRRLFLERYGVSPKEYILNLRIEYAKRLLQSDQFSIGEVAMMCGYSEPCHFSRQFSLRTGLSPNAYKKFE